MWVLYKDLNKKLKIVNPKVAAITEKTIKIIDWENTLKILEEKCKKKEITLNTINSRNSNRRIKLLKEK